MTNAEKLQRAVEEAVCLRLAGSISMQEVEERLIGALTSSGPISLEAEMARLQREITEVQAKVSVARRLGDEMEALANALPDRRRAR